ncbi:hypothetical protein EWM64_g8292 [Hericium alpestre]|uniref:DNA mismatch repair proteins mutS family domain-containing protein n=1 Tax=Hericium alpestre TaxID=135208 RepID=A0A4Y9ZN88_9AGAM|nr:hypothetical protein EWM64_g8292 [Hericium alpestre]
MTSRLPLSLAIPLISYLWTTCILFYADGSGLFCGVLKSLVSHGPDCPKVVAATHFQDTFNQAMLDLQILPISFVHMEVMFTTHDGEIVTRHGRSTTAGTNNDGTRNGARVARSPAACIGLHGFFCGGV